jgi:hypothetical protein
VNSLSSRSRGGFSLAPFGGRQNPIVIDVHLVEMREHRLLELLLGHSLHAGESVLEKT